MIVLDNIDDFLVLGTKRFFHHKANTKQLFQSKPKPETEQQVVLGYGVVETEVKSNRKNKRRRNKRKSTVSRKPNHDT